MGFPAKLWIYDNTKKFSWIDSLNTHTMYFYINIMHNFVFGSKYHVMRFTDI